MKAQIGITPEHRKAVVELLNQVLSDEMVLYVRTRNYHWNVTGPHFGELHKLFEEQYEALAEHIDEVAERVRSLAARPLGTMAEFTKNARLKEEPGEIPDDANMIVRLVQDHETLIRELRADIPKADEKYGDTGTADFLTALMEYHEKTAWMLRAHLEKPTDVR